jgi:hypothetical protein
MEQEQAQQKQPKFFYNNIKELVAEWQNSDKECSLWEYLEISEVMFKTWISNCKSGVFEN